MLNFCFLERIPEPADFEVSSAYPKRNPIKLTMRVFEPRCHHHQLLHAYN